MPFIAATALRLPLVAQDSKSLGIPVQNLVELTPGLEVHFLLGHDLHGLAGSWITRLAGVPLTDTERAKATQLDPITLGKRLTDGLEHGADHCTGVAFRNVGRRCQPGDKFRAFDWQ